MKTWLMVIIIVLVVAALGVAGYFYVYPKYFKKTAPAAKTATPAVTTKTSVVTDPGVTWITPKKLDDLKLVKTVAENKDSSIGEVKGYYQVADLAGGGTIILAVAQPDGPSLPEILRFKLDAAGKYHYLVNNSAEKEINVYSKFLAADVLDDYTLTYQSITPPAYLTIKNTNLKLTNSEGLFSALAELSPKNVASTDYGLLYQTPIVKDAIDVGAINFSLKLADSTYRTYTIKFPFLTDDEVALVTWTGGTKNAAKFTAESYTSCGMTASNNVILAVTDIATRLKEAGTTSAGEKIYTVAPTDVVMKKAYENYKVGRNEKDILTIEQFAAKKPVFIWKNGLENYVVFTNREFGGLAECGKPVIYLYPEKPTTVSVKVGATITKSDPLYQNGWTALAYPSGKLVVNGQTFPYLFWEGQGQNYPMIQEGVVVKSADVAATLKSQLTQLGLNQKESADFLEFWLPKMPTTPYTRLTWFGTKLMDQLAPLAVSPKPDTTIRIFLDFEGINAPLNLKSQNLTSVPRRGFTLVEWGGLLR